MSEEMQFTISDLKGFANLKVWKSIAESGMAKALMASEENDAIDPFREPTKIARNQGLIEGIKFLIDLPAVYLSEAEYNKKEEERKNGK
jgi:hypothetical protein